MRGLASLRPADAPRLRRWDAVVLGGALPGLIAAVRLGQRGARVLVIEEEAALDGFFGLREPFALTGWESGGVLATCLRELAVPLIDRRRLVEAEVAVQIATSDARIDFGRAPLSLAELTAWGLVKPETGRVLLEALGEAARAESEALLAAPIVRSLRRRWLREARARATRPKETTRSGSSGDVPDELRPILEGLVRALSDAGDERPAREAVVRLVGGLLSGAAALRREEAGLRGILRRRIEALLGEFRRTSARLELWSVGGYPAVGLQDPKETCSGRALILNAPLAAIASACQNRTPVAWRTAEPARRRVSIHYRGEASALPEGMRERVVSISRPDASDARAIVTLQVFPGRDERSPIDLIASAIGPAAEAARADVEAWIRQTVRNLIPFSENSLEVVPSPRLLWDDDALLADETGSRGWPRPTEIRLSQRPSIYRLDRSPLAPLGLQGDVLLGWRAGDAIAEGLAPR